MSEHDELVRRAQVRVGTTLKDKWRIDALLGMGGMATVYAGTHRNQKRVAIKMLHPEISGDASMRTRFLREGYVANTVGHPGAVSVHDDDVAEDGAAFLVMELLEGETLDARRARGGGKLPVDDVLSSMDQLLDVLAAAHDKGIVHRDLKPENLFITKGGALKVLDFGIARLLEGASEGAPGTRVGMVMGTPAFMAPEQARARWDLVDGQTDLWAVGATMFTLLSGRYVREAGTINEELALAITVPAPSLAAVVPGLPPAVVELVDRALAYEKADRWPDARAMQQRVREVFHALRSRGPSTEVLGAAPSEAVPATTMLGGAAPSGAEGAAPSPSPSPSRKVVVFGGAALAAVALIGIAARAMSGGDAPATGEPVKAAAVAETAAARPAEASSAAPIVAPAETAAPTASATPEAGTTAAAQVDKAPSTATTATTATTTATLKAAAGAPTKPGGKAPSGGAAKPDPFGRRN